MPDSSIVHPRDRARARITAATYLHKSAANASGGFTLIIRLSGNTGKGAERDVAHLFVFLNETRDAARD